MTVTVFGYLFVTILFLHFLLNFNFNLEDISNTQDSVSPHCQSPQSLSKILCCVIFSTLFTVFRNVVKHGLSCLIYYINEGCFMISCHLVLSSDHALGQQASCKAPIPRNINVHTFHAPT